MTERRELESALASARAFTQRIASDLPEAAFGVQFDPGFSPIGWHLGHIAWQEELWVLRRAARQPALDTALDDVFDSFISVKSERGGLLPSAEALWGYLDRVREHTLRFLETCSATTEQGVDVGQLVRFIANHERQHAEIIGIVRWLGALYFAAPSSPSSSASASSESREYCWVPGGRFTVGAANDPDSWDNERPAFDTWVSDFEVARAPVSSGAWLEFMRAGGYDDERLWSDEGNAFRRAHALRAPLHWSRDSLGGFAERTLAGVVPVDPERAVSHVSWHEARAFARFAGARLLTEIEWEYLASWDPITRSKRRWPWGNALPGEQCANLGLRRYAPARADDFAAGAAGSGAVDLIGGVWEWVEEAFMPYPGFEPQAYAGYSQPWFDGHHRVARGGSFLSQPEIARSTFRNWYPPETRQVPLGLRLAKHRTSP